MGDGGGMTENQRASWILSHSRCSEVTYALSLLTSVSRIGSDQHVDLTDARMVKDFVDVKKLIHFFTDHNPFSASSSGLWNIFNGITDSTNQVNVENAYIIGKKIQNKLTNKSFKDETLVKRDQAVTMKVLKKGLIIAGQTYHIDTRLLTQRILACISLDNTGEDAKDFFNYELSTLPVSLFDPSTQQMRKTDKSALAHSLDSLSVNVIQQSPGGMQSNFYILDGGALIHQLPWSACETYGDVIRQYECYVSKKYGKVTIVFDGYEKPNIKDMEHKLRMKQSSSVIIAFDENSPLIVKKDKFLSNHINKQRFINVMGSYFRENGHSIIHAEGDADTLIVKEALKMAQVQEVTVVSDDTDILILLLYHSTKKIFMKSAIQSGRIRDIQAMQQCIGKTACQTLLFVHALTGCDTTSALFGKSKFSTFKIIMKSEILCKWAYEFGSTGDISKDHLIEIGCKIIVSLYGGNMNSTTLNNLRYEQYVRKIASAKKEFDISRLPPTENAAKYHLLRVHLQSYIWRNLHLPSLDPLQWGWQVIEGRYQPIFTDMHPAPETLLQLIKCACKTSTEEPCNTMKCTCRRYGLPCSIVCKNCCGKDCTNNEYGFYYDGDDDEI